MENVVYEPREDSYLLERYVRKYCDKNFAVLDIGTGTGIQAICAAQKAKKVIACDNNPKALAYARESALKAKINNIRLIRSDLFENIPRSKFDLIIFNPPYLPKEKSDADISLYSERKGTEITVKFLDNVSGYLKEDGTILMVGSSLADSRKIENSIKSNLLTSENLEKVHIFFEDIYIILLKKSNLLRRLHKRGIKDLHQYAAGKRGIILKGRYRNNFVAIKAKKESNMAPGTVENEVRILQKLNEISIGPKLLFYEADFLAYRFVDGILFPEFLQNNSKESILKVLKMIFDQLYNLDKLGINKFEMHHPVKHILIDKNTPVLIDFERARYTMEPKNVTQFCDYLSSENILRVLGDKQIFLDKETIINRAKNYKHNPTIINYKRIVGMLK